MNDASNNPYQAPSTNLINLDENKSVLQFKRFSAWGVFALSLFTFGVYPFYWLATRAKIINSIHSNKITDFWLSGMLIAVILSLLLGFFGPASGMSDPSLVSEKALLLISVVNIAYAVFYFVVLFKSRNRLQDIISASVNRPVALNSFFTFLFSVIYLQFKINESSDECGDNKKNEQD